MLAYSAYLALVSEYHPQHTEKYGLLMMCLVTLPIEVGIVPREKQDLEVLLYPMLHMFEYRDLSWAHHHPGLQGDFRTFHHNILCSPSPSLVCRLWGPFPNKASLKPSSLGYPPHRQRHPCPTAPKTAKTF